MADRVRWTCSMLVIVLAGSCVCVQGATDDQKAIAYQAARADAIGNLAEQVEAMPLNGEAKVSDLVASSPQVARGLVAFLAGADDESPARYLASGTCWVVVAVDTRELFCSLKQLYDRYCKKDGRVKSVDFERMLVGAEDSAVAAKGRGGAVASGWQADRAASVVTTELPVADVGHMSAKSRKFWSQHVGSYGRTIAIQQARRNALARLARKAQGVLVAKNVTVKDYVADSDEPDVNMETFIRGARETGIRYHDGDLIVELETAVKLRNVYLALANWGRTHYKGNAVSIAQLERLVVASGDKVITDMGIAAPPQERIKNPDPTLLAVIKTAVSAPAWVTRKLRSVGIAEVAPQAEDKAQATASAYKAARKQALRSLAEQVNSLSITPNTAVFDFATQNPQIEKSFLKFLQGGREIEMSRQLRDDGRAELAFELDLKPLWNLVVHYQKIQGLEVK